MTAKSKKRKRLILISVGIIVLLLVIAIVKNSGGDSVKVTAEEAMRRDITETVVANGKIQPETEVIISSAVSGEIIELPVKEGDKVQKGQLLVKINPDLAQAALDRAQASYNNARASKANAEARVVQAEAQLNQAELAFDRNKVLREQNAISQAEFEDIKASYLTAKAEVEAARQNVRATEYTIESAKATVKEASDSYQRTEIYAPMSGTISSLRVEIGEQVVGAIQMTGTEIMRIANLDVMEVVVDVNESDIVRVAFHDTALIEVDAYLDRKFTGVVTEIASSANSAGVEAANNQITNFQVKIRILKSSYEDLIDSSATSLSPFRPGMNATVDIQTATAEDVLSVPIQAVTSRPDTSGALSAVEKVRGAKSTTTDGKKKEPITCVFVAKGGKAELVPVSTGIQDDTYIEIKTGLSDSVRVITGPYEVVSQKLSSETAIEIVSEDKLYSGD